MMNIGKWNTLKALRSTDHGFYLIDEEQNEVLLPNKYIPEGFAEGTEIDVFLYRDSEDRLVATTETPLAELHEFTVLEVTEVNKIGAFADWGLEKELLIPFSEQKMRLYPGKKCVLYVKLDEKTQRLLGTTRIERYLEREDVELEQGQEVDLLICEPTEIGMQVIINNKYIGLLYDNELFQAVIPGEHVTGYVKHVRPDKKVDVMLQKPGYEHVEPAAEKVLQALKMNNGFLALTDKSDPVVILARLEMSKKTFKKAIGALYKQQLVRLEEDGIYLSQED
ncbi:MAG: GntR family transcriptional regulator [Bacteroidales bacterium]|nr:GntR family transcriptional regulator [Bacteroidales bacterium]